jgi:cytochrome c1
MLRALTIAAAVAVASLGIAFAAGDAEHPHDHPFSFDGFLGNYDMESVQRGYQVYAQVCASCHSMDHLSYRHLGEKGGPFAAYLERDHETGEMRLRDVPGPPEHGGRFIDVTENPWVRAIAAGVTISDIDPSSGQVVDRPGRISDRFRRPFENEIAARAANGGAYPPDLSVITSARHGGADYIYALLTGYTGEMRGTLYENPYFPGRYIAMAPPLAEGAIPYSDPETPQTVEQYAEDVVSFLRWAADPHMEARKRLGLVVMVFLIILAGLLYLSYKQVWRGESH